MATKKKPRTAAQKAATARMLKAAAAKRAAGRKPKRGPSAATKRALKRPPNRAAALRQRIDAARKLSRDFHDAEPTRITRVKAPSTQVAMVLGVLEGVIYRTPDGTKYLHEFRGGSRPKLAATHDGRQLIVSGGRYRMTDRGIVDKR